MSDATKLILEPSVSFATVNERLVALGCEARPSTMVSEPILPGEPELAQWRHCHRDSLITYTFNPAVLLRVLALKGGDADELRESIAGELACLSPRRLKQLLAGSEARELLLGLYAVRELGAVGLLDRVDRLKTHGEPLVAQAAQDTFEQLALSLARRGAQQLEWEKASHPDRSALFPRIGDAHTRRQMLRWLATDPTRSEDLAVVLRTGLEDEDWEVRATAMLIAARKGIGDLWQDVKRIELPRTGKHGPDAGDRAILKALRKAVLEHLADEEMPHRPGPDSNAELQTAAGMRFHLRRLVAEGSGLCVDNAAMLVHSLTTPLGDAQAPDLDVLPQVVAEDDRYWLEKSEIELCWVPAVQHWLESDGSEPGHGVRFRLWNPSKGFFIARYPFEPRPLQNLPNEGQANPREIELSEARELCTRLSEFEQLHVSFPTPEQWESAIRGPDGRRHPWGNGMEGDPVSAGSPWGVKGLFQAGEWALEHSQTWIVGYDKKCRPAERLLVRSGEPDRLAALRPIVSIPERT
ncbi:MAG: hypothetical protein GY906_13905 [bacterium]|nr:hypothetical protein [bacterium]